MQWLQQQKEVAQLAERLADLKVQQKQVKEKTSLITRRVLGSGAVLSWAFSAGLLWALRRTSRPKSSGLMNIARSAVKAGLIVNKFVNLTPSSQTPVAQTATAIATAHEISPLSSSTSQ